MLFKTFLKKFQVMQLCQPMDGQEMILQSA